MAYYLDFGKSKYCEYPKQPSLRLRLRNYEGPYDPDTLRSARDELLYHVECKQNMTAWSRIRMKTPVNVNGIRDEDDGYGEASNMFSHAELPESKDYEEPYHDGWLDFDDNHDTKQASPATVKLKEENRNDNKTAEDKENAADDNSVTSKQVGTITIDLKEPVKEKSNVGEINYISDSSDCIIIDHDENEHVSVCIISDDDEDLTTTEQTGPVHGNVKPADAGADLEKNEIEKNRIEKDKIAERKNEKVASKVEDNKCSIKDRKLSKNGEVVKSATAPKPVGVLENIFKCDHCEERCRDKKSMHEHLVNAVHYSASSYNVDDVGEVVLRKNTVIKNMEARYKTIIMKCPVASCKAIFPQMDECVSHFNTRHWKMGMTRNQFGLVDITRDRDYTIALKPLQCCHCSLSFQKMRALNSHMTESHFHFIPAKYNYRTFTCNHCKKHFSSFEGLLSHHKSHKIVDGGIMCFRLFEYGNLRKFAVSSTGRVLDESLGISGKRKHDQTCSETEPKIKISKTMEGIREFCSITVDIETNDEQDGGTSVSEEKSLSNTDTGTVRTEVNQATSAPEAVQSGADSEAGNVSKANTLQNTLKCDYCFMVNSSKEQMLCHLNEMGHRSASSVLIDSDKKVQFMEDLSSILSVSSQRPKVYATCTENCRCLFSSVYKSIEHNILCHNSSNDTEIKPCYGVAEVLDEVILKLSPKKCIICGEIFKKLKKLSAHYHIKHFPFSFRDGCKLFFGCVYCPNFFLQFRQALNHIQNHKNDSKNELLDLSVLYVKSSIKKVELPQKYSSNAGRSEKDIKSIQLSIQKLEESCKNVIEKGKKTKTEKRLKVLKQQLVNIFC